MGWSISGAAGEKLSETQYGKVERMVTNFHSLALQEVWALVMAGCSGVTDTISKMVDPRALQVRSRGREREREIDRERERERGREIDRERERERESKMVDPRTLQVRIRVKISLQNRENGY